MTKKAFQFALTTTHPASESLAELRFSGITRETGLVVVDDGDGSLADDASAAFVADAHREGRHDSERCVLVEPRRAQRLVPPPDHVRRRAPTHIRLKTSRLLDAASFSLDSRKVIRAKAIRQSFYLHVVVEASGVRATHKIASPDRDHSVPLANVEAECGFFDTGWDASLSLTRDAEIPALANATACKKKCVFKRSFLWCNFVTCFAAKNTHTYAKSGCYFCKPCIPLSQTPFPEQSAGQRKMSSPGGSRRRRRRASRSTSCCAALSVSRTCSSITAGFRDN